MQNDHTVDEISYRRHHRYLTSVADHVTDLAGELADLLDDRAQRADESEDGGAAGFGLAVADRGDRRLAQAVEQRLGARAAAVGVTGEEGL